jgi:hypothetical protein
MDIRISLVVDLLLLIGSLFCVLKVSEPSIFNPSLWYLVLHAYTVTFRLITLSLGAQSIVAIGIQSDIELINAAIASDVSLLAAVAATFVSGYRVSRQREVTRADWVRLSPRVGWIISIFCLTIGTYALLKFGTGTAVVAKARGIEIAAIDIGSFDESSYPIWISGFAVQGALIQCALRGFTRWRVIILVLLLFLSSFNARTAFVLASAMAFLIYQTRRNKSSMPVKGAIGIVLLGLVWFVYKPVVGVIASGGSPEQAWATARDYFENSIGDNPTSIDTQFLDMQATYMAAADEAGRRYYGSTILPLLYLPIPRFAWPDKPPLNEYGRELSTSSRMMAQVGMTPNLTGESYLNFGRLGCAIIPFLYVLAMQSAYRRVAHHGMSSAPRWVYLIYLISMVQVFRDGLDSLVLYPLMVYLPLLSWSVISRLVPARRARLTYVNGLYAVAPS